MQIDSHVLNNDNGWKFVFTELDKFKNEVPVQYTVEEEKVSGYTTAITGNSTDGYVVTNSKDKPTTPTSDDSTPTPDRPNPATDKPTPNTPETWTHIPDNHMPTSDAPQTGDNSIFAFCC